MTTARVLILVTAVASAWSQQADPAFPLSAGEHRATVSLAPAVTPSESVRASMMEREFAESTRAPQAATLPTTTIPIDIDWCKLPAVAASALPVALPDAIRRFEFCSPNQPLTQCRSVSGGGGQVKVCGSVTEFRTRGFIRAGGSVDASANITPPTVVPGKAAEFSPCNRIP